jgi:hypothetical protein
MGTLAALWDLPTAICVNSADTGPKVSFQWRVPVAQYEAVKTTLHFTGTIDKERDKKGLPLVFIFIGVTILPYLADAILKIRQKLVQPGLKIDARGADIKIDIDSNLPRGTILLVDTSGAKIFEPDQISTSTELVKILADAKIK